MNLIKPSYEILTPLTEQDILRIYYNIERAGRISWKSEEKMDDKSYEKFIPMIMSKNHESVLEHEFLSIKFIINRGVSHELVRHRIAAMTQESTRYCNYSKDKFDNNVTFIIPPQSKLAPVNNIKIEDIYEAADHMSNGDYIWAGNLATQEEAYFLLLQEGWKPQEARDVLGIALKTEIIFTANIREWRHIFHLRTAPAAHPQMREVMIPLLQELKEKLSLLFNDINVD